MSDHSTLTNARASLRNRKPREALRRLSQYRIDHPDSPEAVVLEGQAFLALGQDENAIETLSRFVAAHADAGAAHSLLGLALTRIGHFRRAAEAYRCAVKAQPADAWAHFQYGEVQAALGNLNEAARAYQQATHVRKGFAQAHRRLGDVLMRANANNAAVVAYSDALSVDDQRADIWVDLGVVLDRCGNRAQAINCFNRAINLNPTQPDSLNNLSHALRETGRVQSAQEFAEKAVLAAPDDHRCLNTLCLALLAQSECSAAIDAANRALALEPSYSNAHYNLGNAHRQAGNLDSAQAAFEAALHCDPSHAGAGYQLGGLLIQSYDLARGWPMLARSAQALNHTTMADKSPPTWDGRDAAGKRILLSAPSLLRDSILLLRNAERVQNRGLEVTIACPSAHLGLARSAKGVSNAIPFGEPYVSDRHDLIANLYELPALLGVDVASVSPSSHYIVPTRRSVDLWRERLAASNKLKVGVALRGRTRPAWDQRSSMPLEMLGAIAAVDGTRLIFLDKPQGARDPAEQISASGFHPEAFLHGNQDADDNLLSLVASLDLVIAVDSVVAHLACAAGIPAWVVVEPACDWCWPRDGAHSTWHPTARLIRRDPGEDWHSTTQSIAQDLSKLVASPAAGGLTAPTASSPAG